MRLTKSTSHAIRILIDCARASDGLIKVASLSERLEITPQNVFKIVNLLTKARSDRGGARPQRRREAGAAGAADPHRRRGARHRGHACGDRGGRAAAGARGGHGVNRILDNALEAFIEVLDQHTIADMVKTQARRCHRARRKAKPARRARASFAPPGRAAGCIAAAEPRATT